MSKKLIISPHSDDAIFSLGDYLANKEGVIILSPFMGIPEDEIGERKHLTLKQEHRKACDLIGAKHIDGSFLDDVYPNLNHDRLREWLYVETTMVKADEIYIPLGIHHHDHLIVSDFMLDILDELKIKNFYFYEELPYRLDWPGNLEARLTRMQNRYQLVDSSARKSGFNKYELLKAYESQVDEKLLSKLITHEKIWEVIV